MTPIPPKKQPPTKPAAVAVPAKPVAATPVKKPVNKNLYAEIAAHLSKLGGKIDPKTKEVIRAAAPVMVAGGGDGSAIVRLPGVFSTRCATIDAATGRGGIPMARITTITSEEAGGKTTIALHTCAEAQEMGGVALYIDNEHKLDLEYAQALGVDLQKLLIYQPGTIEDALMCFNETVLEVHRRDPNIPVFGVLDSINASKSEAEYEEDGSADFTTSNQGGLGLQARIMSDRLPKIARLLNNRKAAFLMISQPRDNIGGYGGKNKVAGGNAPKFYSALVIDLIRLGFWKEGEKSIGSKMMAKMIKNQIAAPFKEAEFYIRWGAGIDGHKALIDRCVQLQLISAGSGGWLEILDPKDPDGGFLKCQGMKGWHKLTQERPELIQWLKDKCREPFNNKPKPRTA